MTAVDPDADLETLEQQRDFLLRSLEDLDAEHQAGDIDEADYRQLTDDYTARTAAVLRAIEAASAPGGLRVPAPAAATARSSRTIATGNGSLAEGSTLARALQSRRRWRRVAIVTVIAVFGAITAWSVSQSSGQRSAGQTATGNRQLTGPASTIPGGIDPRFVQASDLVNQGKVTDALKVYDSILKDDPNQPVALANDGWLLAQAGLAGNRSDLVDLGLARIVQAEKNNSAYAAAHFFRGFLLLKAKNDPVGAVTELRTYLGSVDPTSPEVPTVTQLLDQAIKAAGPSVPPGPNAPTTIGRPAP